MITCVIIDDEENNIINLQLLLQRYCNEVVVLATATNADEGIEVIKKLGPDILFLDIQMPGKNGFQLLQSLQHFNFEIIFVTAYDMYGIQAIKFAALDYLLKPIKVEELEQAVNKAIKKIETKKQNTRLLNLIDVLTNNNKKEEQRIALSSVKETRFVQTQSIIRCESLNNYTAFYLDNGEKMVVAKPIYEYEELLRDYGFIRCHQSHLVNKKFIKSWIKDSGDFLLLTNETQVPVSRQKKEVVKKFLF